MVKVLIVQMQSILGDKKANFEKITNLLKGCESTNPDLIIFPELFATGWYCDIYSKVAENIKNYHDIEQTNLYTLHIPKESIKDIKKLREVAELISDSSILNKLIWK